MKKIVLTMCAISVLSAVQASAAIMIEDTDGNGTYSYEEMVAALPDLTEDQFAVIDEDESGEVDAEELAAATEEGLIKG